MSSPSVSAPSPTAARRAARWPVVVALTVNLLLSLPLATAVAGLVDPGYASDPDVVAMVAWFFVGTLGLVAVGATALCLVVAEGRRLAVAVVAAVGLVLPAAIMRPWA